MKKPNITEGEWKIKEDSYGPYIGTQYDSICTVDTHNHDAQAISAVPEMIDALIENLKHLELMHKDIKPHGSIKRTKEALQKAGVEI